MDFSSLLRRRRWAHWAGVEKRIRSLMDALPEPLPTSDREIAADYLDHNELGLALEHLCDALIEADLGVTEPQYAEIARLFEKMELDPSNRLESIHRAF